MLTRLEVKNFALIEDVCLDFSPGLNILTGETGAGKSIILGAIKLLLGDRASSDNIRAGCTESLIQGIFKIPDKSPAWGELEKLGFDKVEVYISREVNRQGKNMCRLNGVVVPLLILKKVGQHLIDLHGQHEHQSLLDQNKHLQVLDLLCGKNLQDLKKELQDRYLRLKEIDKHMETTALDEKQRARELDLIDFQVQEIESARLTEGEEEKLSARLLFLANAENLYQQSLRAYSELVASANQSSLNDRLQQVIANLTETARIEPTLDKLKEQLLTAAELISDTARELRVYGDSITIEPGELAEAEKRIEEIEKLKKKYGNSIKEMLAYAEDLKKKRENLLMLEETLSELLREKSQLAASLESLAQKASQIRKEQSKKIEAAVKGHLAELSLENAVFKINIAKKEISPSGFDQVEFLFSANPGEPEKPLQRIVSGGELSRVMLSLKNVMADWQWVPTLIFDELDAGIGGKTVQAVGEKVLNLSSRHQVICITHWPQIAALSHKHFSITKEIEDSRTVTKVHEITGTEIAAEIARMLDGGETGSLSQAKNILKRSAEIKNKK